ncbi:DNA polymerase III subunit gamma/tau [Oxynema sp. CENA135]|uniref:DNA polymerase III subunit gamma/tau n=1 Tax=Oxynema sp. CENA135 TaxID=984206 RepID=UPI00190A0EE5|nr:DNA polymerase III subunit gamma/tau [Oxynema sp. CENA135]MBK4729675.1 DNA polymerase III subunit gamma/tau [Oxynema sp. CENA135]
MSYEPLHHKYRPQTFADLVGQEAIAATLTHAIRQQKIAPAYLFAGPRGTGKTSSARILAKSLNCLNSDRPTDRPCGTCEVCRTIARSTALDVIEIDAASNTGVDNIRDLIERAQFAPVQCRHKVYIIDECHMLSTAAFNSLLKTLEEPPEHVVFVLATTDPQRVLPTIISRCQRFDFRRIPVEAMVAHLQQIARQENISIDEDAVVTVAQLSQGGLRDAESLLDQLSLSDEQVSVERVWNLVGAVPERDLLQLLEAIAADDGRAVLDSVRELMDRGREPLVVLQNLARFYRDLLVAKTAPDRQDLVAMTADTWQRLCEFAARHTEVGLILAGQQHLAKSEAQIKNTTQPRLWLEVALLGLLPSAMLQGRPFANAPNVAPVAPPASPPPVARPPEENPPSARPSPPPPPPPAVSPPNGKASPVPEAPAASAEANVVDRDLAEFWHSILDRIDNPSLQALLRQHSQLLEFEGNVARVGIASSPLQQIVNTKLDLLESFCAKILDRRVKVKLEVCKPSKPKEQKARGSAPAPPSPAARQPNPSSAPPVAPAPPMETPRFSSVEATRSPVSDRRNPRPTATPATPAATSSARAIAHNGFEDEVTVAAKRLAEFFQGELVNLDEDWEIETVGEGRSPLVAEDEEVPEVASPPVAEEDAVPKPGIPDPELDDNPFGEYDF